MLIRRRGAESPASEITPEALVLSRRVLMGTGAILLPSSAMAQAVPAAEGLPAHVRNEAYTPDRALTSERDATTYNNYYEFGTTKSVVREAARMPMRPWRLSVGGLAGKPREFEVDDILRLMPIEERAYRLRCVEAWAMTVPWSGFRLSELLKLVEPQSGAKFVAFETANLPAVMPGLRQIWYPWPHVEACTIEEAQNELTFMPVGMYGKPLSPQNGGPLRVVFPWKYGFKSGKSLVKITLTAERPRTFWPAIQGAEYGFWGNVNPEVAHPRWSQATERLLGSGERVPTRMLNGYAEQVGNLYTAMRTERIWF